MKIKRIPKASVIEWLKKIFTLQSLAVIAGFIAALYAYKSYKESQPAQINVVYFDLNGTKTNLDKMFHFEQLLSTNNRKVDFDWYSDFPPYPCILNDTKKSIKDFRVEVAVYCGELLLNERAVQPCYEIAIHDTVHNVYLFKYKYNVLNAKSFMPMPIISMYLPDSISISKDTRYNVTVKYEISYDGISRNRNFIMNHCMYFEDRDGWFVSDNHIDEFLTYCYQHGFFTELKDSSVVAVFEDDNRIVNPPKRLNDVKFEKFKKEFIESRK